MLSIGKITPGRADYYEASVAQGRDDYYSGKGEAPGTWVGRGAQALGLTGRVEAERFQGAVLGLDPSDPDLRRTLLSTQRKARTIKGKRHDPVAAYDLTFSAPKSVSTLFALVDVQTARELVAAHDAAVRSALEYVEASAVFTRRGRNGWLVEQGQGLIAAAYRHRMARSKDPQLHTHVVAMNVVRTPSDGRWRTLHAAVTYRHARTAGVLYQAHLRAEVRDRLGLRWGPVVKGAAEIDGIPREVLREFSRRRIQIEQEALTGSIGMGTKAGAEALALKTRQAKDHTVRTADWRLDIHARAQEHGFDRDAVDRLLAEGRDRLLEGPGEARAVAGSDANDYLGEATDPVEQLAKRLLGSAGLTEMQNTFGQREVLVALAEAHQQGLRISDARAQADELLIHADVLAVHPVESAGVSERRYTTRDLVACERRLINAAVERINEGAAVIDPSVVDRALTATSRPLTGEQEQVVRSVIGSGNGVDVVEALAGTGKTFTAGAMREIYAAAGIEVLGVAPTARAARELGEVGIPASTMHATLMRLDRLPEIGLPRNSVVVLDEAGMAPTRLTERLLDAARQADAKLIAIGDSGQLPSVEAGGWMHEVGERVGVNRLTAVQRQRDSQERRALGLLHSAPNGGAAYLSWLDQHGRLRIDTDASTLAGSAVHDWARAVDAHGLEHAVLIARDHDTRRALNAQARAWHAQRGGLGEEQVYGALNVACGDRVITRRNDHEVDVDNGTRGTVTDVYAHGIEIRTDGGSMRTLPSAYVEEHVEHAYALTGHGVQAATVEWAGVVARSEHLTRGWAYTALSRARGETRLYVPAEDMVRREERADIAPHDTVEHPERREVIDRIARRMLERDDEDLAVTQLIEPSTAGHATTESGARDLGTTNPATPAIPQEVAAAQAEPPVPPADIDQLLKLTQRITDLEAERDPQLTQKVQRLTDLEARTVRVRDQRDRAQAQLDALPDPERRRFRADLDPYAGRRAQLNATIEAADAQLGTAERDLRDAHRDAGVDAHQFQMEERERQTAIAQLDRERIGARDRIAERVTAEQPEWAIELYGPRPHEATASRRWDEQVRERMREQLDRDPAFWNDTARVAPVPPEDRSRGQAPPAELDLP